MELIAATHSKPGSLRHLLACLMLHQKYYVLLLFFSALYVAPVNGQTTITGTIRDTNGITLQGVSVKLQETLAGAVTNEQGKYSLRVQDLQGVLVFSYIGYTTQQVRVNGRTVVDMIMIQNDKALDGVVVVGYGTQKKATLTGAVAQISGEELNTTQASDLVNMMAGKLPGLRVAQKSGGPGNYNAAFDIRGLGTPLVLVDGVEVDNPRSVDPNEIESVSILKDASAAVYGVRAANGVVLITTKKGVSGKSIISYSGTYGWSELTNENKPLDIYQWAVLHNEARYNGGATGIAGGFNATVNNGQVGIAPRFTADELKSFQDGTVKGTNWYDLIIQQYAPIMQHNISASGGTEKIKYFVSLGYLNEEGLWKSGDNDFKKYSFRSNITAQVTKNLEASFYITGIQSNRHEPWETEAGVINITLRPDPDQTPYANNNPAYLNLLPSADNRHPIAGTYSDIGGYRDAINKNFSGQFALTYKIPFIEGLRIRGEYSRNNSQTVNKSWKKAFTLYSYDVANDVYNPMPTNSPSTLTQGYSELTRSTVRASINYDKTLFKNHTIRTLLLFEQLKYNLGNLSGSKRFALDAVDQLYAGLYDGNQTINNTGTVQNSNVSVIGRLNYDYKGKYLLEGTFNQNGSSKFGPGQRWGFFPAVLVGWRISEEEFIKNKFPFITNLKFRASWGKLGDDASSTYQWLTGYTYPGSAYVFANGTGSTLSSTPSLGFKSQANPDLTWFESTTTNIGLDGVLWGGKLSFTFEVFRRLREGLLATQTTTLPGTLGTVLPQVNLNSDKSQGLEITLSHADKIGKLRYNVTGNVAYARNIRGRWDHAPYTNSYIDWRQNPEYRYYGIVFGYDVAGQFQSQEDILKSPVQDGKGNQVFLPGDIKYQDYNEDGIIDDNDVHAIGRNDPAPEINFGFTFNVAWKGFDVNLHFSGGTSFFVRYQGLHLESPLTYGNNGYNEFYDRWHRADVNDPNSAWVPGKYPSTRILGSGEAFNLNHLASTYWIHDAKFLRLKSTEIGYSVPSNILKRIGISKLRIYANGFNLLTWTGLKLVDPELWNNQYGLEYPITKNYNFGVNVTL